AYYRRTSSWVTTSENVSCRTRYSTIQESCWTRTTRTTRHPSPQKVTCRPDPRTHTLQVPSPRRRRKERLRKERKNRGALMAQKFEVQHRFHFLVNTRTSDASFPASVVNKFSTIFGLIWHLNKTIFFSSKRFFSRGL
ncbi:hypothetical protein GE061_002737, partial [Apolygus lucorum]